MKIITVRQPHAWQLIHEAKDVENRRSNLAGDYRGTLAISAGKQADEPALAALPMHPPAHVTAPRVFDYGVVLGVVTLANVHVEHAGCCPGSTWAFRAGPGERPYVHHVVRDPVPLSRPLPYTGHLGMREVGPTLLQLIVDHLAVAA